MLPSLLLAASALSLAQPASASAVAPDQDPPRPGDALAALEARVRVHRLENGWTFLLLPLEGAPVVAFETMVPVGAIDEPLGRTGLAHVLEHMAFKGSDRLGSLDWKTEREALAEVDRRAAELAAAREGPEREAAARRLAEAQERAASLSVSEAFTRLLEEAGGMTTVNASTSADATRYVVTLPASRFELWCWLERERFTRAVLREFYRERQAVLEERRMRVDSSPYGLMLEELQLTALHAHPYRRPVIGFESDLRALTRADAREFLERHYGARHLVTAIVGRFDPDEAIGLLERYFADIPPGPQTRALPTVEPEPRGPRRALVRFPSEPLVAIAWPVPSPRHRDDAAVEMAVRVLGHSASSRLDTVLVREKGLAAAVYVAHGWPGQRAASLAWVLAIPNAGTSPEDLEEAVLTEVRRLAEEGPTDEELAAARRVARAERIFSMRDRAAVAKGLTTAVLYHGDWREFFRAPARLGAVDAADVRRVTRRWLDAERRTTVTLLPPPTTDGTETAR